jgi:hypothetical protein
MTQSVSWEPNIRRWRDSLCCETQTFTAVYPRDRHQTLCWARYIRCACWHHITWRYISVVRLSHLTVQALQLFLSEFSRLRYYTGKLWRSHYTVLFQLLLTFSFFSALFSNSLNVQSKLHFSIKQQVQLQCAYCDVYLFSWATVRQMVQSWMLVSMWRTKCWQRRAFVLHQLLF